MARIIPKREMSGRFEGLCLLSWSISSVYQRACITNEVGSRQQTCLSWRTLGLRHHEYLKGRGDAYQSTSITQKRGLSHCGLMSLPITTLDMWCMSTVLPRLERGNVSRPSSHRISLQPLAKRTLCSAFRTNLQR